MEYEMNSKRQGSVKWYQFYICLTLFFVGNIEKYFFTVYMFYFLKVWTFIFFILRWSLNFIVFVYITVLEKKSAVKTSC